MRSTIIGTVLALATVFAAAPAMAGDKHEKASFPMPAAAFKQRVDARQAKARERMEKRASTLGAEQAKELRAKFDAGVAKINAEVNKAVADGTVTKEEADAVRKVSKEVRGHHGKHAKRGGKHGPKGGDASKK
ncbi:MAG: hypothetical protein KIS78_11625 [Labilithrix sp.]|nr:hypothetical protein [Labilithrix sp.]MCW5833046.1 hypothetical protein [Labilithrix sp.]